MKLLILPFLRLNFAIRFKVLLSIMNYFNVGLHTINLEEKKLKNMARAILYIWFPLEIYK